MLMDFNPSAEHRAGHSGWLGCRKVIPEIRAGCLAFLSSPCACIAHQARGEVWVGAGCVVPVWYLH